MSRKFCVPALAALTLAAISTPVMAEPRQDTNTQLSAGNVSSGEVSKRPSHLLAGRKLDPRVRDCIHVQFPQCAE
jgi:hypothetical protein